MKDSNLLESPNIKKSKRKTLIILSILALYALLFLAFGLLICQSSILANVYSIMKDMMKKPNNTQPVQHFTNTTNVTSVIVSESVPLWGESREVFRTDFTHIRRKRSNSELTSLSTDDSYLVKTKGCLIPGRNPSEESVKNVIPEPYPIECKSNTGVSLPLVLSNRSAIFVNKKARGLYYNDTNELNCCWRLFTHLSLRLSTISNSKCTPFNDSVAVNWEFIKVECKLPNAMVYQDYFTFLPGYGKVKQSWYGSSGKKLSVLVVGMNSVSRLNLHRAMPFTAEALQRIGAIEMLGYNKVGNDSYENVVPILTGLGHEEFDRLCPKNNSTILDTCPFIWKNYSDKGYRTIFAEDTSNITIFDHIIYDFRNPPTDYYPRPFWKASESVIGNARKSKFYACSGTSFIFDRLLNYASAVASKYADKLYFGLFWESIAHDFIQDAKLADKSYQRFFDQLHKGDLLRNTALIFTSDHGMRNNSFAFEENLPFLYVRMPDWWKLENPEAWQRLKENAARLTTPFDLHATLRDILEHQPFRSKEDERKGRPGISLFRTITEERNCKSASIPEHCCTCHNRDEKPRHDVSRDPAELAEIGNFLVGEINKLIAEEPRCAKVKLSSVVDIRTINDANNQHDIIRNEKTWNWTEYSVIVQTLPGRGIFEGNVRYKVNEQPQLMGYISRMDNYVNQSSCINGIDKRHFCYCV